ncbi:MAG: hypothetical protein AB1896_06060 [Thermodesulfobacteriota bacterium]
MDPDVRVDLAPGAEEIGLAVMLQSLILQNLEAGPHKTADFCRLDLAIGMVVPDAEIEMTLDFKKGTLTIRPGLTGRPGLVITAASAVVMALSNQRIRWGLPWYFDETGREILAAMKSGRLKVKGLLRHFPSLVRLGRVMSVH